jgi:hypothetical protein
MAEIDLNKGVRRGRAMESFRERKADWVVEFDGSLKGVGYRVFVLKEGKERLVVSGGCNVPFNLNRRSEYQNAMELTASVVGLMAMVRQGVRGVGVRMRGDSTTVLSWSKGHTFRSDRSLGATMVLVAICEMFDVLVTRDSVHLTSAENYMCDGFSRGMRPDIGTGEEGMFESAVPGRSGTLESILMACNPLTTPQTEYHFMIRWNFIRDILKSGMSGERPW